LLVQQIELAVEKVRFQLKLLQYEFFGVVVVAAGAGLGLA
jgi:hypothetical protein